MKVYVSPKNSCKKEDWYPLYVEPDDNVELDMDSFRQFCWWIHERQEIWDKRVNKQLPPPWTDDKILREYKFTHAVRDLDRLTIYYIKNILSQVKNDETSIKELILNTMIYRIFCKIETYEAIGYIRFNTWDKQIKAAEKKVLAMREAKEPVFTSAYMICGLTSVQDDPSMKKNKAANAFKLIHLLKKNIDTIYDNVIHSKDMSSLLQYFISLPCIGVFNAYEFICDLTMAEPYYGVKVTPWSIDSEVSTGPGAHRGLGYVFKNKGNLSDNQCIIYLRSVIHHYLNEFGYGDVKLPKEVPFLNLRCIEHSLCEYQKYRKTQDGTGRPRVRFKQRTTDINQLKL